MLIFFPFICVSQVKVLYGGTELFDDEVRQTFHNDMKLAVISGACIAALVYVLTSFSGKVWPDCCYSAVHLRFSPSPIIFNLGFIGLFFYSISHHFWTHQYWTELFNGTFLVPCCLWGAVSGYPQRSCSICYYWHR